MEVQREHSNLEGQREKATQRRSRGKSNQYILRNDEIAAKILNRHSLEAPHDEMTPEYSIPEKFAT